MHIFVKVYMGKTITLSVKASDTIGSVKAQIQAIEGIPIDRQLLMFGGIDTDNVRTLSDYRIHNTATLQVAARIPVELATLEARCSTMELNWRAADMAWKRAEDARSQWAAVAMQMGWTPGWQIPPAGVPDAEQPAASTSVKAENEKAEEAPPVVATTSIKDEDDDAENALSARQRKRRRQRAAKVL